MELSGGGWSWVEIGVRFSNTRYTHVYILTLYILYECIIELFAI